MKIENEIKETGQPEMGRPKHACSVFSQRADSIKGGPKCRAGPDGGIPLCEFFYHLYVALNSWIMRYHIQLAAMSRSDNQMNFLSSL